MIILKILRVLGVLLVIGGAFVAVGLENATTEQFNNTIAYCYLSTGIGALLILVAHFFISMPPSNNCVHNP